MNWKTIFDHLNSCGFEVYAPAQHEGLCLSPYLVLKVSGVVGDRGIELQEYEILLYVPQNLYSETEEQAAKLKLAMNALYPTLKLTDYDSPPYLDDGIKGYMTSLTYTNVKTSNINTTKRGITI